MEEELPIRQVISPELARPPEAAPAPSEPAPMPAKPAATTDFARVRRSLASPASFLAGPMPAGPYATSSIGPYSPGGGADYGVTPAALPPIGAPVGSFAPSGPSRIEEVPQYVEEPMEGGMTLLSAQVDARESAVAKAAVDRGGIHGESMVSGIFRTPRAQML